MPVTSVPPSRPPRRPTALPLPALLLAMAAGIAAALLLGPLAPSRDLMALWLAAGEVAAGTAERIYPPAAPVFTMYPDPSWYARAETLGRPGVVYPYLYPPLWAYLVAPLTKLTSFQSFATVMLGVQAGLVLLIPLVAARLAHDRLPPGRRWLRWWAGAMAALVLGHGMPAALLQGQPQVLVAFLTLLGLERAANGRPVAGGVAMGLVIALKLAPLPLALLWLVAGQRRAGAVALVLAAGLALVSVALAGWPLHQAFLDQLRAIDRTALLATTAASFDILLGGVCCLGSADFIPDLPAAVASSGSGWHVLVKPALWTLEQKAALIGLGVALAVSLRARPGPEARAALWAAAATAMAFFGPIGWVYYYIVPLALSPLLPLRLGVTGLGLAILSVAMLWAERMFGIAGIPLPYAGLLPSVGTVILLGGFLAAGWRRGPGNRGGKVRTCLRRAAT